MGAFRRLLAEQRVGLVLQIDPHAAAVVDAAGGGGGGEEAGLAALLGTVSKRGCGVWPIDDDDDDDTGAVPSIAWDAARRLVSFEYGDGEGAGLLRERRHYWYYGWRDFTVPPPGDDALLLGLAEEAAATIRWVRAWGLRG